MINYKTPFLVIISLSIIGILSAITGQIDSYIDPVLVLKISFFGLFVGIISEEIQRTNYYRQPKILYMATIILIVALLLYQPFQDTWIQLCMVLMGVYIIVLHHYKIV